MTIPTALAAPHSLDDRKQHARTAMLAVRAQCDPAVGKVLAEHVLSSALIPRGAVVAGFWPMAGEIDVRPLLHALAAHHDMALPRTPPRGQGLRFHRWRPGDGLRVERFGAMASDGPEVSPTVLLVPLLAFDRRGHRLGYGGGYYDHTLAGLPDALTIGCAFAAQEMPEVPVGAFDKPLHFIATEHGVTRI